MYKPRSELFENRKQMSSFNSFLEERRRLRELIDRLIDRAADEMGRMPRTHRAHLQHEHFIANIAQKTFELVEFLKRLTEDKDGQGSKEISQMLIKDLSPSNDRDSFEPFYTRLAQINAFYRDRSNMIKDETDAEFEALLNSCRISDQRFDAMFSGEEAMGRFLDLQEIYLQYTELMKLTNSASGSNVILSKKHGHKLASLMPYLSFIDEFDNFTCFPINEVKEKPEYMAYLNSSLSYLKDFFMRTRPLDDLSKIEQEANQTFDERWSAKAVSGWEDNSSDNQSTHILYCTPCSHQFTNQSVFQAHMTGKKHKQAMIRFIPPELKHRELACKEFLIKHLLQALGDVREETKANVERKAVLSYQERMEDLDALEQAIDAMPSISIKNGQDTDTTPDDQQQQQTAVDDQRIYNPLKLPLDWDGKPIPYWLWKLHGLGVEYPCEICGNYVYMGRRAFDQHFHEWRHANAMKCLGIPNTKHFFQITSIVDAQTLWDKLRQQSKVERFKPDLMEEFEDQHGNVYVKKTFEDLRRQGII